MKTKLIFFDTPRNSGELGTARGAIAIVPIVIPLAFLSLCVRNTTKLHKSIGVILLSLVLCSAIGVQLPSSYVESITYSFLMGLVVSISYVCIALLYGKYRHTDLACIPLLCAILIMSACVTRALSVQWNLYGES